MRWKADHPLSVSPKRRTELAAVPGAAAEYAKAAQAPERLAYSVDEAAAVLGIARETIYELIRTGQLRSRKAGSRRIIARHHILEFLDGEPERGRRAG